MLEQQIGLLEPILSTQIPEFLVKNYHLLFEAMHINEIARGKGRFLLGQWRKSHKKVTIP